MNESLPEGGIIRKMWSVEAGRYREHLLRLDPASRRNRFGSDASDEFLAEYATLATSIDTVIHGFFVNGTMRGAAELRPIGASAPARGRSGLQHRAAVAEPRRWLRAARAHPACGPQSRHHVPAYGVPRRQRAYAAARPQVRCGAAVRFRQCGWRGRRPASNTALGRARDRPRDPRLRHCAARGADTTAE